MYYNLINRKPNKIIITKFELLEQLAENDGHLVALSYNALNHKKFVEWMKIANVTEDRVHSKTWWYPHTITKSEPEDASSPYLINIETSIVYDAHSYYGEDKGFYSLATTIHRLECSKEMYDHYNELDTKNIGRPWHTLFNIKAFRLKEELGLFPPESNQASENTKELIDVDSDIDEFFNSF